jgi:hypothetical protein
MGKNQPYPLSMVESQVFLVFLLLPGKAAWKLQAAFRFY